jgi:heptosyltransferase-2
MNRILIVTVNWLGDALMTTPALRALKEKFPLSSVAVMCVPRVKEVFLDNPYIDEVIIFDEKGEHRPAKKKKEFVRELRAMKFDAAFFIHRSFTRLFLCWRAGIPVRVGYHRFKTFLLLTQRIKAPDASVHRRDYYLALFERAGVPVVDRTPRFFISYEVKERAMSRLQGLRKEHDFIVGMHVAANWEQKRWPQKYFAALADRLSDELNCAIVCIGSKQDKEIVAGCIAKMKTPPLDASGETTLKELGALFENMDLFISNDSGPAHLAAAVGGEEIVLFGPTSSDITAPQGRCVHILRKETGCTIPCYRVNCPDNRCMKDISVDEVFEKAKSILLSV